MRRCVVGAVLLLCVAGHGLSALVSARAPRLTRTRLAAAPHLSASDDGVIEAERAAERPAPAADSVVGVVRPTRANAVEQAVPTPLLTREEYQRGLAIVAFNTLLFASNTPALRLAFTAVEQAPSPLLVSAVSSVTALSSLLVAGPLLSSVPSPSALDPEATDAVDSTSLMAGLELGVWKTLGTCALVNGLSLTSAGHAAFLSQLTTLLVPLAQGAQGVPIPRQVWSAIVVALAGLLLFTSDPAGSGGGASSYLGDLSCVGAACCFAAFDLRLFHWGKQVETLRLIQNKVAAQAALTVALLLALDLDDTLNFFGSISTAEIAQIAPLVLWSGVAVNGVAPFLQAVAQQAVGPARAQVVYASGPLWAALISFFALGETFGPQGLVGGAAFLAAVLIAARAPAPDMASGAE